MKFYLSTCIRSIILAMLFIAGNGLVRAEKPVQILIIATSDEGPYQETTKGFIKQFNTSNKVKITETPLAEMKSGEQALDKVKPDLIFALGGEAMQWASAQTTSIPIVATLVLKEDSFKNAANVTGISLGYSIKTQFQWLKKFFSQARTVAILYDPAENAATVQMASEISQQNGFNLVPIPVKTPKELPYALEQLTNNIDILLAIPDETVMSVNTAKEVLLASFRNKVPLVGLSDNWVKSGAFYALSWDYDDLGRQSAGMAQKILAGNRLTTVPPETPRQITYTINTKIAEHMNMDIPSDLIKKAKKIFN